MVTTAAGRPDPEAPAGDAVPSATSHRVEGITRQPAAANSMDGLGHFVLPAVAAASSKSRPCSGITRSWNRLLAMLSPDTQVEHAVDRSGV